MAPNLLRRRKASRVARNLAFAEAALAMARSRAGVVPAAAKGRGRVLLAGAAAVAAGAAAFAGRKQVRRVLPGGRDAAPAPAPYVPPQPSNYDVPGPVANTATPIPAPDPVTSPTADAGEAPTAADFGPPVIDERAEEEAAAAEAAAIGGSPSDYAGIGLDEPATEAEVPVVEAGGGEAEGQEQAEAELADNAVVRDQAPSDAERQIEDAIEAQSNPFSGETPDPMEPLDEPGTSDEGGGISGRPGARLGAETPGLPPTGSPATEPETGDEQDETQTWSGRADQP